MLSTVLALGTVLAAVEPGQTWSGLGSLPDRIGQDRQTSTLPWPCWGRRRLVWEVRGGPHSWTLELHWEEQGRVSQTKGHWVKVSKQGQVGGVCRRWEGKW